MRDACAHMYYHLRVNAIDRMEPKRGHAAAAHGPAAPATPSTAGRRWQSRCVCSSLRMATRVVTQLYDDMLRPSGLRVTQFSILATIARLGAASLRQLEDALAIDQTTLTRSLRLLQRDGVIERVAHPDARIKAMRLTARGRRALAAARPLWARAQDRVLGELGATAWDDTRRRLMRLLGVAVDKRERGRQAHRRVPPAARRRRARRRA